MASGCCARAACLPAAGSCRTRGARGRPPRSACVGWEAAASPSPRARVRRHRCAAARAPSHVHASVPTPARRPPPPPLLPSRAFRLRASQGPLGGEVPAPKRGDAGGRRRRRGAHVPAESWGVTHHAHLCDEEGAYQSYYMVEYSVPNMNGESNVPRQSCTRERGNNVSRPGERGVVCVCQHQDLESS